jgi:hypothetical protein
MSTSVILNFKSKEEKARFLGQLSDGWGENFVDLSWDKGDLADAQVVQVEVFEDEY